MKTACILLLILALVGPAAAQAPDLTFEFMAFDPAFRGGVEMASCGPDRFGRVWEVFAAGPGGGPHVWASWLHIGTGTADVPYSFFAYHPFFLGGVHVSCFIDDGGFAWLLTSPGRGGGPHVRVWFLG